MPAERAKMLQDAFNATMKDPEFIADVKKQQLELEPQTGPQLQDLLTTLYATPKPVIEKVGQLVK